MAGRFYSTDDVYLNVSRGLVKDHSVVNIFGYNANVGSTDFIPLWEENQNYIFPDSNTTMNVVSDSSDDTDVTILVNGLDSDYEIISTTVDLAANVPVTLDVDFFRINSVVTISGNATGNITIQDEADSTIYAKIRAGEGKNQAGLYTVPAGHKLYLQRIDGFSATAKANKYVMFRNFIILENGTELRVGETTFLNQFHIRRVYPFVYNEKTDIMLEGKSSDQTNEIGIFAEGLLIKE